MTGPSDLDPFHHSNGKGGIPCRHTLRETPFSPRKRPFVAQSLQSVRRFHPESEVGRFITYPGFQNSPTGFVHITTRFRPSHFALNSAWSLCSRRPSIESVSD